MTRAWQDLLGSDSTVLFSHQLDRIPLLKQLQHTAFLNGDAYKLQMGQSFTAHLLMYLFNYPIMQSKAHRQLNMVMCLPERAILLMKMEWCDKEFWKSKEVCTKYMEVKYLNMLEALANKCRDAAKQHAEQSNFI